MWQAEGVTVELPDSVVRRAAEKAAELGIPVSDYVAGLVDENLRVTAALKAGKPWMAGFGALRHLHEETERINRIIEEEFEQIEPDDWT